MLTPQSPNPWILRPQKRPGARVRLFCFPYAGGAAAVYHSWPQALSTDVEVCAIQLPGRGARFRDAPHTRLANLVRASADALGPSLDMPFALFGHSMGALVVFELARELRRRGAPAPVRLLVSGHEAPHRPDPDPPIGHLDDAAFVAEVCRRYDGIPREVLDQPDLMDLVLPVLRADFSVIENYAYAPEEPLDCPISCFGGTEDVRVSRADLEAWQEQTRASFRLRVIPGGHFFLDSARGLVLEAVAHDLADHIPSSAVRSA